MTSKPAIPSASSLVAVWNKDLSVTIYVAGGKKLHRVPMVGTMFRDWLDAVSGFCEGWFCTPDRDQWKIRCVVSK